ncbi:MAG: hypothetical protein HY287_06350 [Planctomycetes bacterium]|nr:hypothetical protein [Planctomycetota bacterium]MBI3833933.1 hypothetical protein [Planctomycetota bacterium]
MIDTTASEIGKLTERSIHELLERRSRSALTSDKSCRRTATRWAFPGAVELWIPDHGEERYSLATSMNLSTTGIGIRCEEELTPGLQIGLAIHEPEASLHGHALVRHSTRTNCGDYIVGLEFTFDSGEFGRAA